MGDHAFEAGLVGWCHLYRAIDAGGLKAKLWLFDGASPVYAGCAGATSSSAVEWGRSRPTSAQNPETFCRGILPNVDSPK